MDNIIISPLKPDNLDSIETLLSQHTENSLHRRCFVKLCIAGSLVLENIERDIKKHIFASKI